MLNILPPAKFVSSHATGLDDNGWKPCVIRRVGGGICRVAKINRGFYDLTGNAKTVTVAKKGTMSLALLVFTHICVAI